MSGLRNLPTGAEWATEVLIFQGHTRHEVIAEARWWLELLASRPAGSLADLSLTLGRRLRPGTLRLGVVAANLPEFAALVESAAEALADASCQELRDPRGIYFAAEPLARAGRLAYVFPGDGSPYPNMLADLVALLPEVREWFEIADRVALENGRSPCTEALYPGPLMGPRERRRAEHAMRRLEISASAVLACNYALYSLLTRLGVEAGALIGHSLGDWSALGAAGVTNVAQFLRRIDVMVHLPDHVTHAGARMALCIAPRELVESALAAVGGEVWVAMHNGPRRVVIAGAKAAVRDASERLIAQGVPVYRLPFVRAAHTPLARRLCEPMAAAFAEFGSFRPGVELWSCTTARPYPPDAAEIQRLAVENMIRPVEFHRTVEHAYAAGIRLFVECGAGGQLADCIHDILGERPHLAVAVDVRQRRGTTQLHHLLAGLAAQGVEVRLEPLFELRKAVPLDHAERPPTPPEVLRAPLPAAAGDAVGLFLTETAAAMESHLASVRAVIAAGTAFCEQFLTAQEQVLTAYLGGPPEAARGADALGPFFERLVSEVPGQSAVLRARLDADRQPYLRDHQIGGFASHDEGTAAPLPLVPLTVTVEMMAQAAGRLFPGQSLCGAEEINARRELSAEGRPELEIRVTVVEEGAARVELIDLDSGATSADGLFRFGRYESPPEPAPLLLEDPQPSPLTAAGLYEQHVMFHGPCFQGVREVGPHGANGIAGRLRSLPRAMLFGGAEWPSLTDPALLDAMGQLFGWWPLIRLPSEQVVFPAQIGRLDFHGPPPQPGDEVDVRIAVTDVRAKRLVANIDLVRDGRLWLRVTRWTFFRFNWPPGIQRGIRFPASEYPSEPLGERLPTLPLEGLGGALFASERAVELPLWIARAMFTADEYAALRDQPTAGRRQDQFFASRLAAKDAVRRWAVARGEPLDALNRVGIGHLAGGAPTALRRNGASPHLSLAHKPRLAVAVAGDSPVGIDCEPIEPRDAAFLSAAFGPAEREALGDAERQTAAWCAKEAAAKLTGRGLTDPRAWPLTPVAGGRYQVATPSGTVTVHTAAEGGFVVALARA